MFDPEVEARFKRIEDVQLVTAELLHRHEMKSQERMEHLEAIQDAMARWMDKMQGWQDEMQEWRREHEQWRAEHEQWRAEHEQWRKDTDFKINALTDMAAETWRALGELSRTVDNFLKARSNGGAS